LRRASVSLSRPPVISMRWVSGAGAALAGGAAAAAEAAEAAAGGEATGGGALSAGGVCEKLAEQANNKQGATARRRVVEMGMVRLSVQEGAPRFAAL
jgi:hypothetical protein